MMPDGNFNLNHKTWVSRPIIEWLLGTGRFSDDLNELVRKLGEKMLESGAPIWRVRLSMRTLHPLVAAVSSVWERDSQRIQQIDATHGMEGRSGYKNSPLEVIGRTEAPLRKRLAGELTNSDHDVFHELKARGGTDYFGLPLRFSDKTPASLVFTSDAPAGFSESDIEHFTVIGDVLAPIAEVFSTHRVSLSVAEAYLGPRTGQRVLSGQITRGDIETISAAIFISDIRDWTGLNNKVGPENALALVNRYFEIIGEAVDSNGGEILKFLGDGVLAIFPTNAETPDPEDVCAMALLAARQALRDIKQAKPPLDIEIGIGIHFGEVLYGNTGSSKRIDFTVMGQSVNTAARIEGLCSRFGSPILFSESFANRISKPTKFVAEEVLKGEVTPSKFFTVSDGSS